MAKRGQNEGSIFKRADGRWCAQVNLGYEDGKRKRKYLYGSTRKEVQERLTKTLRDMQQGLPVRTGQVTVATLLTRWLEDVVKPTLDMTTYLTYRQRANSHLVPILGHFRLERLSVQDVQRFIARQSAKGLARNTIDGQITTLKGALSYALHDNLVARNVATLVDLPPVDEEEKAALSPDEARRFLAAARGDRLENLFWLFLTTGLRLSEARGLMWDDINWDEGTLAVRRQIQQYEGANHISKPKSATGTRIIPLAPIAIAALRRQQALIAEDRHKVGMRWQEWNLIFPSRVGKPFGDSTLKSTMDRILTRAEMPHYSPHQLRHSAATFMAAANVNPKIAMDVLGHSTVEMTMKRYQHVTASMRRTVAEGMETLLGANTGTA
jgi:integrase